MEGGGGQATRRRPVARRGEQRLADMEFNHTEVLRSLNTAFDSAWRDAERQLQRTRQRYIDGNGITDFTISQDDEGRSVYTFHDPVLGEDVNLDPGLRAFRRGDRIVIGIDRNVMDGLRDAARRWGAFQMTEVVMRNSESPPRVVEEPVNDPEAIRHTGDNLRYEGYNYIRMQTGVSPEFAGYFAEAMARRIGMPAPPRALRTISLAKREDRRLLRAETRDPYEAYFRAFGGPYTEPYGQATVPRGHIPLFFYQERTRAGGREFGEDAIYVGFPPWIVRHVRFGSSVPERR